jgi:ribosomal protein L16 Arg81 hydroxylase
MIHVVPPYLFLCIYHLPKWHMMSDFLYSFPPTDGGGLRDFYHNWTNSILQQMKRKFWKIADALFRIS